MSISERIKEIKNLKKRTVSVTCYLQYRKADRFKELPGKTHGERLEFLMEFYDKNK